MFDRWKLRDFAPGDVHRTLIAASRIPDPFYDRNELACTWIEEREWWYRLEFVAPSEPLAADERLHLLFHGLDTFVTIWLNGQELGYHQNMFRAAVFDVTGRLRPSERNILALCFHAPLTRIRDRPPFTTWGRNPERVWMRQAQFGYGWDWGPRLPTVGIWRPVELRRERQAVIRGLHFYTLEINPQQSQALVAVRVEAERFATSEPLTAHVHLAPSTPEPSQPAAHEQVLHLDGGTEPAETVYLQIDRPQLWWTYDLGTPALYELHVRLQQGEQVLDESRQAVGIRTITLDQSPDTEELGTRFFRFVLNGVPLFARGANWIPTDSFVGALTPERYKAPLAAARDAHMNMLRVWGGGIYEHDAFYDRCNRLGMLVWQDFMFACAMYPEDDATMVAEVEAEARYQVQRLRNHPCLALWCGNNENQWIHDQRTWRTLEKPVPGARYYHTLLPAIVAEQDGRTPYWPGSPYGGNDYNSMADGDVHNWQVWHGQQPRRFGEEPVVDRSPEGVSFLHYAAAHQPYI